jgi:predicted DNA binding CopG/RHH family protein
VTRAKLPHTDSIRKLAQFWDTHDLTDFEDQLEEVKEPVFEPATAVTVHLSSREARAVKRIAKNKGIKDADLIRQWVLEKVGGS